MEYKDLVKVNSGLKTIPIKGREYVEVNARVMAFRELFPEGAIKTELLSAENGVCIIRADVFKDNDINTNPLSSGIAYEKESSSFINKTSYIENCETSAVGRALGFLGIGIDTSIASAEEVETAIANQDTDNKTDDDAIGEAEGRKVMEALVKMGQSPDVWAKRYKVKTLSALTAKQQKEIGDELRKLKNEKA